jgi:hypothetical protein
VCPELRAPYFAKIQIPREVALSYPFISWTSLWTEIIQLALPRNLDDSKSLPDVPPPIETVCANVVPPFLNRGHFTNGLNHSSSFVAYTVCQSVHAILLRMEELGTRYLTGPPKWRLQWEELMDRVVRILPDPATITSFCSRSFESPLLRHAGIKTLFLYTKVFHDRSFNATFDPKVLLAEIDSGWDLSSPLSLMAGLHLLNIIDQQEVIDWWSKQGMSPLSFSDVRFSAVIDRNAPQTACHEQKSFGETSNREGS